MTTDTVPGPITPIPPAPPMAPPFDAWGAIWRWTRILLARNPFYIISAVLLLWSMRQPLRRSTALFALAMRPKK